MIYPCCLNCPFGAHSLWRHTLLTLNIIGSASVLPQRDVLDFLASPWEALFSLKSGWGLGRGEVKGTGGARVETRINM